MRISKSFEVFHFSLLRYTVLGVQVKLVGGALCYATDLTPANTERYLATFKWLDTTMVSNNLDSITCLDVA